MKKRKRNIFLAIYACCPPSIISLSTDPSCLGSSMTLMLLSFCFVVGVVFASLHNYSLWNFKSPAGIQSLQFHPQKLIRLEHSIVTDNFYYSKPWNSHVHIIFNFSFPLAVGTREKL